MLRPSRRLHFQPAREPPPVVEFGRLGPVHTGGFSMKDRTWITVGSLVIVAFWTILTLSAREHALFNSSLRAHFILKDGTVDRDIAILGNRRLLLLFNLYSLFLIGFIPVVLQRLFRRLTFGLALIAVLSLPS